MGVSILHITMKDDIKAVRMKGQQGKGTGRGVRGRGGGRGIPQGLPRVRHETNVDIGSWWELHIVMLLYMINDALGCFLCLSSHR